MTAFRPICATPVGSVSGLNISAFREAVIDDTVSRTYLVEITLGIEDYKIDPVPAAGAAIAAGPLCGGDLVNQTGGYALVRFSDNGYITAQKDPTNPDVEFPGRASVPLTVRRSVSIAPEERIDGTQRGDSLFEDGDGEVAKYVARSAVDGRPVRVLVGPTNGEYDAFSPVFTGVGKGWMPEMDRVRLEVRDRGYTLDSAVQTELYEGTGDAEGDASLEGGVKPLLYGKCRNVTPVLVDQANLVYQVHDGQIEAVDAVYDRGAALTAGADYATYVDLIAGGSGAGTYDTCLATGHIMIGGSPDGLVTADVRGDKTDGEYVDTPAEIVRRIMSRGEISDSYIAQGDFDSLALDVSAESGYYITDPVSMRKVVNELLSGIGASWWCSRGGKIRVGRLKKPSVVSRVLRLTKEEILSLEQVALPETIALPNWRRRVSYRRFWTQQNTDLAATISDSRRQELAREWRIQSDTDTSVRSVHLEARNPDPVPSYLDDEADALSLAEHLLDLYGIRRRVFAVTVKTSGHLVDIFDNVFLVYPRYGLEGGQAFRCVGIREDCARAEVTLFLWG